MLTRRFGRTGLDMPMFSCGGMRFQQSWQDTGQPIEEEAQDSLAATVLASLEHGAVHLETARGYGTSERQLGMLMPQLDSDKIILQTKIAPTPNPDEFEAEVLESLQRLQVLRVDLLALHGVNTWAKLWWSLRPGGCLARARELQQRGLIGSVGFSTHAELDLIMTALRHEGDGGFDYVNLHWYFIRQDNWPAIDEATRRDIGVFIISPSDKGGRLYDPPQLLRELCAPLDPIVFNNAWCLAHEEVHTLSLGAGHPSDFQPIQPSLDALGQPDLLATIEQRLAEAMCKAVGVTHPDHLAVGLPEWDVTPGFVNLRVIVWLRALALGWGMKEYAQGRYRMLGNASDWFPGLSAARAPDWEAAIAKAVHGTAHGAALPEWLAEAHELLGGESVQRLSTSS